MAQTVKKLPAIQETQIQPESGRSSGEENGNTLQCSCLENSLDRRPWWATFTLSLLPSVSQLQPATASPRGASQMSDEWPVDVRGLENYALSSPPL